MPYLILIAFVLSGCAAVSASAPLSSAAIAGYELVNLRQLPLPDDVKQMHFERPATGQELRETRARCLVDTTAKFARPSYQGLEPGTARPSFSEQTRIRVFDGNQEKQLLGFLDSIRSGWSVDSVVQSSRDINAALAYHYNGRSTSWAPSRTP